MRIIKEFYDRTGLYNKLRSLPLHDVGSPIGYDHFEVIESFMMSVIHGVGNITGASQVGYDEVLKKFSNGKKGCHRRAAYPGFSKNMDRASRTTCFRHY